MAEIKYTIEGYKFQLIDCNDKTCKIKFEGVKGQAFEHKRRKLYIIREGDTILYIGEANCSIKERFQRACTSYNHYAKTEKARGGYKGYKWLNKELNSKRQLIVNIAIFPSSLDEGSKRGFVEAIEGEIVFLVRNQLGYWPKFQNEIHFQNVDGAKEIAEEIFNEINHVRIIDKMEESMVKSLQQAEALKESILKKAFQGKVL